MPNYFKRKLGKNSTDYFFPRGFYTQLLPQNGKFLNCASINFILIQYLMKDRNRIH